LPATATLPDRQILIGGALAAAGSVIAEHVNPSTGQVQANVSLAGPAEVDAAVAAARAAQPGWAAMPPDERRDILLRWASIVRERYGDLAALAAAEYGAPLSQSRARGVYEWITYYAGWVDKLDGQTTRGVLSRGLNYTLPDPYGVVGVLVPSNGPVFSSSMTAVPALAAGNAIVLKPTEYNPFTCVPFALWALEAGMPPGVLNVVPGPTAAGQALVAHPQIDKIAFTGGVETGKVVMAGAATHLTPVLLELGGKSANVVFDDADVAQAARLTATLALVTNSGQACCVPTRLLVQDGVYDEVVSALRDTVAGFKVGMPLDPSTVMGPVISQSSAERILGFIDRAKRDGARLVSGGARCGGDLADGFFIEPTVFSDVDNASELAQEEVFGPVLSVTRFRTEQEGIALANDTRYGLAAFLCTSDVTRAHRVAAELNAGYVSINGFAGLTPGAPFGGVKASGFGREGGRPGIEEFLRPRNVFVGASA
jgi:aldehyde dehydrogenase (NAD+)